MSAISSTEFAVLIARADKAVPAAISGAVMNLVSDEPIFPMAATLIPDNFLMLSSVFSSCEFKFATSDSGVLNRAF